MPDTTLEQNTPGGDVVVSDPSPAEGEVDRPELDSPLLEGAEKVKDREGKELTKEQILDRYQDPPVYRDPNTPISPLDPNDRLRAEGPEVADPAKVAAGVIYEEAKANMPERPEDTRTAEERKADEERQQADDLARFDTVAATGPGSGVADTSQPTTAPAETPVDPTATQPAP